MLQSGIHSRKMIFCMFILYNYEMGGTKSLMAMCLNASQGHEKLCHDSEVMGSNLHVGSPLMRCWSDLKNYLICLEWCCISIYFLLRYLNCPINAIQI